MNQERDSLFELHHYVLHRDKLYSAGLLDLSNSESNMENRYMNSLLSSYFSFFFHPFFLFFFLIWFDKFVYILSPRFLVLILNKTIKLAFLFINN